MRKRSIVKLGLCGVLGAVTSIGIAWKLALIEEPMRGGFPDCDVVCLKDAATGKTEWTYVATGSGFGRRQFDFSRCMFPEVRPPDHDELVLPQWVVPPRINRGFGLPLLSLRGIGWDRESAHGYLVITDPKRPFRHMLLPVMPIWPGFIADTVLFSAGWGTLLACPGMIRRRMRLRRGRCVRCNYDLSGNPGGVCPECGYGDARP